MQAWRLQHSCFPVNIEKFANGCFFINGLTFSNKIVISCTLKNLQDFTRELYLRHCKIILQKTVVAFSGYGIIHLVCTQNFPKTVISYPLICTCVRIRGYEMLVFRKILCNDQTDCSLLFLHKNSTIDLKQSLNTPMCPNHYEFCVNLSNSVLFVKGKGKLK